MGSFRWFKPAAGSFVKVPFFGAVSYLTLAVCPFCIVFAVLWGVYRRLSFAWIGQDILVSVVLFSMPFVEINLQSLISCLVAFRVLP
jgi:signal peptide peptidase-like protein 2B